MFKLLDVFFENKEIDSGGARVNSYSVEFYKKTYDLYEEINYDKREPFEIFSIILDVVNSLGLIITSMPKSFAKEE